MEHIFFFIFFVFWWYRNSTFLEQKHFSLFSNSFWRPSPQVGASKVLYVQLNVFSENCLTYLNFGAVQAQYFNCFLNLELPVTILVTSSICHNGSSLHVISFTRFYYQLYMVRNNLLKKPLKLAKEISI